MEPLHKWVATLAVIFTLAWGGLAYYVKTEIAMATVLLQNRILVIEQRQDNQDEFIKEVRELRGEIVELKVALAGVEK